MSAEPASTRDGSVSEGVDRLAALRSAVGATRAWRTTPMPWRETSDPYAILVSEIMLQQTQVARVVPLYERFLASFPTLDALATAPLGAMLERWQGLGYNRRALNLKRAAEALVSEGGGVIPDDPERLERLPGVGPATAGAVATYAFGLFAPFMETNIRAVFIHHLFSDRDDVSDREILPYVIATWDRRDPRSWGYALTDHGAWVKREFPNPSRRSRHHVRQSPFEGSRRQLRARMLRAVLAESGRSAAEHAVAQDMPTAEAMSLLEELVNEGFLARDGEGYSVSGGAPASIPQRESD